MAKKSKTSDPILEEIISIKKLLILTLLNQGLTQSQIAQTLGIDRSNISRMIPAKILKANKK